LLDDEYSRYSAFEAEKRRLANEENARRRSDEWVERVALQNQIYEVLRKLGAKKILEEVRDKIWETGEIYEFPPPDFKPDIDVFNVAVELHVNWRRLIPERTIYLTAGLRSGEWENARTTTVPAHVLGQVRSLLILAETDGEQMGKICVGVFYRDYCHSDYGRDYRGYPECHRGSRLGQVIVFLRANLDDLDWMAKRKELEALVLTDLLRRKREGELPYGQRPILEQKEADEWLRKNENRKRW